MNPIIKFTTLFGLLAVELAVTLSAGKPLLSHILGVVFFLVSVYFVRKSFYGMRIRSDEPSTGSHSKKELGVSTAGVSR